MTWRKGLLYAAHRLGLGRPPRIPRPLSSDTITKRILRKLKEHHSMLNDLPPKEPPPSPYVVMKGAVIYGGPVIKRSFEDEEISVSVIRKGDLMSWRGVADVVDEEDEVYVHVDISKAEQKESLHFICAIYDDRFGIDSFSLGPKSDISPFLGVSKKYNGRPVFRDLDEKIRDGLYRYIGERGINESLYRYLLVWRYERDHIKLKLLLRILHTFVKKNAQGTILMEHFASLK